jgi:tetratricopeptide (TPR) repeat protein
MTAAIQTLFAPWTRNKAFILAVACLAAGIAGGWAIRGSQSQAVPTSANVATATAPAAALGNPASQAPSPERLKQMADAQAAPQVARLAADPNNPELLASVGNIYYDARQYSIAIDYYQRSLKSRPTDAGVRTDMGTAYWYMGNADSAIAEFNKALSYAPNNPNTLFNRGLVEWQGKKDGAHALADWEKLLATDPSYQAKDKVEQMMAEVKGQRP